jgi:dTDP-4-amino-4,6-dideoxygalactose transaminase
MDPARIEAAIGPRTKAIMPVHLYGQAADMDPILAIARRRGLRVIEDAAQAHNAEYHGRRCGSMGDIAGFSFYPGKNLGAYGDAGAVVTDDEAMAVSVRTIGSHGGLKKYVHDVVGVNSRLDALQAVVLRAKLSRLERWNTARRAAARRYDALLDGLADVVRPVTLEGNVHVWHLYVVRVPAERRDAILAQLNAAGIGAGLHYPIPVHLTPAFAYLGYGPGSFPHAERGAAEILSLPLYPQITAEQQERVVTALAKALAA